MLFTGSLFNFLPVLLFSPLVYLGCLPILVLKKSTLTSKLLYRHSSERVADSVCRRLAHASREPSRFSQLITLLQPSSLRIIFAYSLGSIPILLGYLWCATSVSKDARLGIFYEDAE